MIREALLADGDTRLRTKLVGNQSLRVGDVVSLLGTDGDWEVLELTGDVPEQFTGRRKWDIDI